MRKKININHFFKLLFVLFFTHLVTSCYSNNDIVESDTLYISDYSWTFSVDLDENIFIIKAHNEMVKLLSENNTERIGFINSDYSISNFQVNNKNLCVEYESEDLKLELLRIQDLASLNLIENLHLSKKMVRGNFLLYVFDDNTYTHEYCYLKTKKYNCFSGENMPVFSNELLYTYNKVERGESTIYSSSSQSENIDFTNLKGVDLLYLSDGGYIGKGESSLYFVTLKGEIVKEWNLSFNPEKSQIILKDDKIKFYYWKESESKFYLVESVIDISDIKSIRLEEPIKL